MKKTQILVPGSVADIDSSFYGVAAELFLFKLRGK